MAETYGTPPEEPDYGKWITAVVGLSIILVGAMWCMVGGLTNGGLSA
jgi:hypothetical protein